MRKIGPLHYLGIGSIGGLYVAHNGLLLFGIGFSVGAVTILVARAARRSAVKVGGIVDARTRTEFERMKTVRAGRRLKIEKARELRADRDRRETAAYWRGVADGSQS
jgi:hypothetical protein